MTDAWIGGLLALGGVTLQAVIQARLAGASFRREKQWAQQESRRVHLEQTYEAAQSVLDALGWHYLDARQILPNSGEERRPIPWARLQTLVALYVPELREYLVAFEKAGEKLVQATIFLALRRPAPEPSRPPARITSPALEAAYTECRDTFNHFAGGVRTISDRLSSDADRLLGRAR